MLTPRSYETIKSVDHLSVDDINKSSGKSSWTFVFKIGFLCFTDQTNKKIVYRLNNNEKQILKVTPKLFPSTFYYYFCMLCFSKILHDPETMSRYIHLYILQVVFQTKHSWIFPPGSHSIHLLFCLSISV